FDAWLQGEGAATARALEATLASELAERTPDRDEAAAVADAQFALGRQPVARRDLARIESGLQVEVHLVMHRDGTELQAEARHRQTGSSVRRGMHRPRWGLAEIVIML